MRVFIFSHFLGLQSCFNQNPTPSQLQRFKKNSRRTIIWVFFFFFLVGLLILILSGWNLGLGLWSWPGNLGLGSCCVLEYVCEFAAGLELELALVWAFVALIYFLGRVIYICNKNRPNGRVVGYSLVGSVDFGLMVYTLKSFFF